MYLPEELRIGNVTINLDIEEIKEITCLVIKTSIPPHRIGGPESRVEVHESGFISNDLPYNLSITSGFGCWRSWRIFTE